MHHVVKDLYLLYISTCVFLLIIHPFISNHEKCSLSYCVLFCYEVFGCVWNKHSGEYYFPVI